MDSQRKNKERNKRKEKKESSKKEKEKGRNSFNSHIREGIKLKNNINI